MTAWSPSPPRSTGSCPARSSRGFGSRRPGLPETWPGRWAMPGFPWGWRAEMATIVQNDKPVTVDPLRHSAPLGAVLAFLGVARCMPLLHSSQGCAAMAKTLLTRHFRESIPLQTSALTEVTTILGSGDSLLAGIATVADRQQPDLVGVITTG